MQSIPKVRQWLIRTAKSKYVVLAPTRKLAILNFRVWVGYDPIVTIGVVRKERNLEGNWWKELGF